MSHALTVRRRRHAGGYRARRAGPDAARRHRPFVRRRWAQAATRSALLVVLGATAVTACSSGAKRSGPPTPQVAVTVTAAPVSPLDNASVQNGFGGTERFCAEPPLSGHILYDGSTGTVRLALAVSGLPPNGEIALNWLNNTVRGYEIAFFRTNAHGEAVQSTLRIFRPGETR